MMTFARPLAAALALVAAPAIAQTAPPPKLVVVISVDQFSADLFAEYRSQFREGFARLLSGAVFPSGYQSHASTETCPGHSTILTGARPARTGIVANDWTDFAAPRADKTLYCAEDESVPGSNSDHYTVSDKHLKVPTLGEWMKLANPGSRVVSVAGKDRAAVMMGGHKVDELWWWGGKGFVSYAGRAEPGMVTRVNAGIAARIAEAREPLDLPAFCESRSRAIPVGTSGKTVGDGRFARAAGDTAAYRASPEFDESILALGAGLATDMKLGQGADTDLLILGASATDYVGHGKGTEGSEMCIQMLALDHTLGQLFAVLDKTGVDYAVALTADHGGHDLPERNREHGQPDAVRVDPALKAETIGKAIAAELGMAASPLRGGSFGDVYIDPAVTAPLRAKVQAAAIKRYTSHPQVEAVFTRAQIEATPSPKGPPEPWSLLQRIRASYSADRSGDLYVVLKPRVTPIANPGNSVATHGSVWDYDRRVPILFWRKAMTGFEQPLGVETVDIAPTLAALLHIPVPVEIDGRCLDLDAGPGDSCK